MPACHARRVCRRVPPPGVIEALSMERVDVDDGSGMVRRNGATSGHGAPIGIGKRSAARAHRGHILALSASAGGVSIALAPMPDTLGITECWSEPPQHAASDRLLANADALLRSQRLAPADLALIAVDIGPGPFTAIRAACAMAQGLALGRALPIVAASSTEILAMQAAMELGVGRHTVMVVIDARMDEWYCATLEVVLDAAAAVQSVAELRPCVVCAAQAVWAQAGPPAAPSPSTLLAIAGDGSSRLFGPGAPLDQLAREQGWLPVIATHARTVRADALAALVRSEWFQAMASGRTEASPRYVRNKVALDVDEQRAARAGGGAR